MALPRTSSSPGAAGDGGGADGCRQRQTGAGLGLSGFAEPGARAATTARQEDTGRRDPQGVARTCHGVKKQLRLPLSPRKDASPDYGSTDIVGGTRSLIGCQDRRETWLLISLRQRRDQWGRHLSDVRSRANMADRLALVPVSVTRSHAVEGPLIPATPASHQPGQQRPPRTDLRDAHFCMCAFFASRIRA
jgi:hypothetical protein